MRLETKYQKDAVTISTNVVAIEYVGGLTPRGERERTSPRISVMFVRFEPIASPNAMSVNPLFAASMVTTSSGADVASETTCSNHEL